MSQMMLALVLFVIMYALLLIFAEQRWLIALGYLDGEPDGVYGPGCEKAVAKYQQDHGLEVTGVADSDLVRTLLETDTGTASAGGVTDDSSDDEGAYADDAAGDDASDEAEGV